VPEIPSGSRRTHRTSRQVVAAAPAARAARGIGRKAGSSGADRMAEKRSSISGLTDEEAQEFHKFWVQGFVGFTAVAVVAHFLVWAWRPWLN
jgi:light-harvesting complex 1 beta chain